MPDTSGAGNHPRAVCRSGIHAPRRAAPAPPPAPVICRQSGAIPERGLKPESSTGREVAFFRGLDGTTQRGAQNTGRCTETGLKFSWKLDSK